jgi:hypothetical protein
LPRNQLSPWASGYNLFLMRLPFPTFKAAIATGLSLWMAVLACLVGCTLPGLANSSSSNAFAIQQNSTEQSQPDLMADMANCPHHSATNAPAKPNSSKPVRGGGMSCCPVEVTVTPKPDTVTLHVAPARDFVLHTDFSLMIIRSFRPAEILSPLSHSGRDTLLETHLLRI